MLAWRLAIPMDDGSEHPVFYHTSFSEKAVSRTKRQIQRLAPDLDLATFKPGEAPEIFGGMNVRIVLRIQNNPPTHEFPGKRNTVRELLPAQESFLT